MHIYVHIYRGFLTRVLHNLRESLPTNMSWITGHFFLSVQVFLKLIAMKVMIIIMTSIEKSNNINNHNKRIVLQLSLSRG